MRSSNQQCRLGPLAQQSRVRRDAVGRSSLDRVGRRRHSAREEIGTSQRLLTDRRNKNPWVDRRLTEERRSVSRSNVAET